MLSTTNAIVLSKLKYRDNDIIVKCYTRAHGVVSFLLRGVLKSKKGNARIAYFQSLSQLQLVFNYTKNKSLYTIKDVKVTTVYKSLHTHVFKSAVVLFLSEVLSFVLKEEEKDEVLYHYLETTLLWFDADTNYANFHLLFLLNLTKYLGFYPDIQGIHFNYFNLEHGTFDNKGYGKHSISGENLELLKDFLGITFDTLPSIKLNSKQRQAFLNMILLYFELHLGHFKTPKSLQVYNQVFN